MSLARKDPEHIFEMRVIFWVAFGQALLITVCLCYQFTDLRLFLCFEENVRNPVPPLSALGSEHQTVCCRLWYLCY